jgi:hypothetical protein
MQLARLEKLDLETGRKILKNPKEVQKFLPVTNGGNQSNAET